VRSNLRSGDGRKLEWSKPDPLDLVIDVLATYRLTRLATADIISEPARHSVVSRVLRGSASAPEPGTDQTAQQIVEEVKDPPKLATLITCRWCAGVWIAAGVVGARALAPRAWDIAARGLAFSAGAALLARFED
jgi:hypothetical protein